MGMAVLICGILGGLCAVMGIITATEVVPAFIGGSVAYNTAAWGGLAVILLLGCIALAVGRGGGEGYE